MLELKMMCYFVVLIHIFAGTYFTWSKLGFSNGLKLEIVSFRFSEIVETWNFVNKKGCKLGLQFIWA